MVLAVGECCSDVKSTRVLICLARTIVMLEVLLSLLPKSFARSMCFKGTDSSQLVNDCLLKTWFKATGNYWKAGWRWALDLATWVMFTLLQVGSTRSLRHLTSTSVASRFCADPRNALWGTPCPLGTPFFSGLPASSRMQGNYWSQCWGPCVVSE